MRLGTWSTSVRECARLVLHLLRLLVLSVGDDGIAMTDQRFLGQHVRPLVSKSESG